MNWTLHAAELYICTLFVAYFVFSPVNAKHFFKTFCSNCVLGITTLVYDVHIYGFWLNRMDLQEQPEVLLHKKTAKPQV